MKEINRATIHHLNKEDLHHAYYTLKQKYFWCFLKFFSNFYLFLVMQIFMDFLILQIFMGFMQGYESCKEIIQVTSCGGPPPS